MPEIPQVHVLDARDPAVAAAIVAVQRGGYRVEADLIGCEGIPPLWDTPEDVMALDLTVLGVVDGGEVVAILGYRRVGERVDLDRLAVHPEHFRRGHGRRLLAALHAREADAAAFDVSTGRDNLPALTLYRKLGYRAVIDEALPEGVVITRLVRERPGAG